MKMTQSLFQLHLLKTALIHVLLVFLSGLIFGCGGSSPEIQAAEDLITPLPLLVDDRAALDQKTFSLRKISGNIPAPGFGLSNANTVIKNASDWASFWSAYSNTFTRPQPLPPVNFQATNVAVVQRQTGCDTIDRIVEIVISESRGFATVIRNEKTVDPAFTIDCKVPQTDLRMVHIVPFEINFGPFEFFDEQSVP